MSNNTCKISNAQDEIESNSEDKFEVSIPSELFKDLLTESQDSNIYSNFEEGVIKRSEVVEVIS